MRSIITLAALLSFLAACESAPTESEIGTVEEIEQSEVTDEYGEIVEDVKEDEPSVVETECEFEVATVEGETVMGNTLTIMQAQGGAYGNQEPSEELRALVVEFDTDDAECSTLTIQSLRLLVVWTDKADTDWQPTGFWAMDRDLNTYEGVVQDMGGILFVDFELDTQVEAGDYSLLAVYVDVTGASTELDDQVRVDLYPDSLVVDDGETSATIEHDGVNGETIVF